MPCGGVGPGGAAVARLPDAAAGDGQRHVRRIARIDARSNGCRRGRSRRRTIPCAPAGPTGWSPAASSRRGRPRRTGRPGRQPAHSRPRRRLPAPRPCPRVQGVGSSFHGPSVGLGGKAGAATSSQLAPRSLLRLSFTPKWPRRSAAYQVPSRGSASTCVTGSPGNAAAEAPAAAGALDDEQSLAGADLQLLHLNLL